MTCTIKLAPSFGFPAGRVITISGTGSYINGVLYRYYMYGTFAA